MSATSSRHPVDELLPPRRLVPLAIQHVLVMAATPITAVFLVSKALGLASALTIDLLSAAFVLSGVGSLVQSLGAKGVGARLPFVMLQGGAPIVLFVQIAKQHGPKTAAGAVILTGLVMFLVLPVFARLLRFFPTVVIGTMIVIIGVNLVSVAGQLVVGKAGTPDFARPRNVLLALATIAVTMVLFRVLRGVFRQLAVLLGLVAGTVMALVAGAANFSSATHGAVVGAPHVLPFGAPHFDLLAALPLMLFSLASMAEATGQTIINGEVVGRAIDPRRDVAKTIRGDALMSLIGGLFGSSLLVTSGENIGIVRVTGVRSRFVTAGAGVILVAIGVLVPIARVIDDIPAAVVGGTALVVYAIVTVLGIQMLRRVDFTNHANVTIAASGLAVGLLPILVPGIYKHFPPNLSVLLGSGVAMGAFVSVIANVLFNHVGRIHRPPVTQNSMPIAETAQISTLTSA